MGLSSAQTSNLKARKEYWDLTRKVIQVSRIRWSIESFKSFKSIDLDGTFPDTVTIGGETATLSFI